MSTPRRKTDRGPRVAGKSATVISDHPESHAPALADAPTSDDSSARKPRARGPGRPRADSVALRERLLDAAQSCFAAQGVSGCTLRAIATEAGVTPALVHYYFVDKQRLFDALVAERVAPAAGVIAQVLGDESLSARARIEQFIERYVHTMAGRLWLPRLLVHEVLSHEGEFRSFARDRFITPIVTRLVQLVRQAQGQGEVRADLDPSLGALSILSLNVFPFVSAPISWPALGLEPDEKLAARLAAHTRRLLFVGIEDRKHGPDEK